MNTFAMRFAAFLGICVILLLSVPSMAAQDYVQIGSDIDGEMAGDRAGRTTAISSDGNVLAVGAAQNSVAGSAAGQVRVFERNGTVWVQRGTDIYGEAANDQSGSSVSLSSDGSVLAVGAVGNDGGGPQSGHVRVFDWSGVEWLQRGDDIDGDTPGDFAGLSISLSSNGNVLVVGAPGNDDSGGDAGHVRVFDWNGLAWIQRGDDIDGEAADDRFGNPVSLSSDGSILAAGARENDEGGDNAGHVRVFEWTGSTWVQLGDDIDGEMAGDLFGWSVSLSSDGRALAASAIFHEVSGRFAGHVRVFDWNGTNWMQRGDDIDGQIGVGRSGESISLSSSGNTLAVGAIFTFEGVNAGRARILYWNGASWEQRGSDIDGEAEGDQFGTSVSLSRDGQLLAVGAPLNDGAGESAGHVRVYAYDSDGDNIPRLVENAGPNSGDGNNDDIPDSEQANVTSFPIANGPRSGEYIVLEAPAGNSLQDVASIENPAPATYPDDIDAEFGFLEFAVSGLSSGAGTEVSLILPPGSSPNEFWKYGPTPDDETPHWYEFSYDGTTGAVFSSNVVTLHFVDGERGDSDLTANGEITDPGAPVVFSGECTFNDLPSWDGNLTISGGTAPTASAVLNVPNGFHSLEVLDGSDNIGLLDVAGLAPVSSTGPISSSVHPGALFERLEYTGTDDAPTVVTAIFGPQEASGSRFLFRLTDKSGCSLQVDPQMDFDTPTAITLSDNYPNPFNPSTRISFTLPEAQDVRLSVYDLMGREIKTLVSGRLESGTHQAEWDGTNEAGAHVASGVYLYRLDAGSVSHTRQMILMK